MAKNRLTHEKEALHTMISIYCRGHRHGPPLCGACQALLDYALKRLDMCKFGSGKSFCSSCPVHCYQPEMRAQIKAVMRYAGPRMLWHHPVMALRHLFQAREGKGRT